MNNLFDVRGRVVVITGGSGILGRAMASCLADAGAGIAIIGLHHDKAQAVAETIEERGGEALGIGANVCSEEQMRSAGEEIVSRFGRIDVLINAAGGNRQGATVNARESVLDLSVQAFDDVVSLNLRGTVLPTLVFAEHMVAGAGGSVINISSVTAGRAVTRVAGYSAAKAAVENFTRWMAVELASRHGEKIRVNAIAPGFFVSDQNRSLLLKHDGSLTERGSAIIAHTPLGRFGRPEELCGAVLWLCSNASSFVTGAVIPVDGGFTAFSGV